MAMCAWPIAFSAANAQMADTSCGASAPAYTADRTVYTPGGAIKTKFYSDGDLQREDQNKSSYRITDFQKSLTYFVNLKAKTYTQGPLLKNKVDQGELRKDTYIDRKPNDDGTTVVEAGVSKDGKKDWFARTVCGADGIFLQQELKVPGPNKMMVTIKIVQENITVGSVPGRLAIPDGLKKK
jgi:hypothetical protein